MKRPILLAVASFFWQTVPLFARRLDQTPMSKVVELLIDLSHTIETDGVTEQKSYDNYACWCEETLVRKVREINEAKATITKTEMEMKELNADLGALGADIENLKKGIAANQQAQREAVEIRDKEAADYNDQKLESEQCIGALEQAIKVLTGAGTGKKVLGNIQEAQLLSVAANFRGLLKSSLFSQSVSNADMEVVKEFASKPESFVGGQANFKSMAQVGNNPFGDYAPQSTRIQGILKGMYDTFTASLEKNNGEEAEKQKGFEELMVTKKAEVKTLELTLHQQTMDEAEKTKALVEATELKDDTKETLEADETFFADAKVGCKAKATEWSERSRLRTEEMLGIKHAIKILSSPVARQIFMNSTNTFLQVSSSNVHKTARTLMRLARSHGGKRLSRVAAMLQSGGHFDKVILAVDEMIALLRKEEQSDIQHRDRCQAGENKYNNDVSDIHAQIEQVDGNIKRLEASEHQLRLDIKAVESEIEATKEDIEKQKSVRNRENAEFKQALKDDESAVQLLKQAITLMSKFYKKNKIPMALLSRKEKPPEGVPMYTYDPDKAPETSWSGSFGGRRGESKGVMSIIAMIMEDIKSEMKVARKEEAEAQKVYEESMDSIREVLESQTATKTAEEQELAELAARKFDGEKFKAEQEKEMASQQKLKGSLHTDCLWVKTHFKGRWEARKNEINGLVEAKGYLAGVEDGNEIAP
mmetsp:Transcript_60869/g.120553  ORF Transcript_60869/g.120553 Transcript_60869/m.120553 type:complete len:704 (+) Transcript_60869:67-2178(+)